VLMALPAAALAELVGGAFTTVRPVETGLEG